MTNSVRPLMRPERFDSFTEFMTRCTLDQLEGFNQDGSQRTFQESREACLEAWDKAKKTRGVPPGQLENLDYLIETEGQLLLLTEDSVFLEIEH